MSAPLVAGTAALTLFASGKNLSAEELKNLILSTAQPLPSLEGKVSSGGIPDVAKAVETALKIRLENSVAGAAPESEPAASS